MKCFNIHSNCAQGISYLPLSANYGATGTQRGLLRGAARPQVLLQPVKDVRHFPPCRPCERAVFTQDDDLLSHWLSNVSALSHRAGDQELEILTPWPPRPAELFLVSPLCAEAGGAFHHCFVGALLSGASHPASLFLVVLF